MTVVGGAITAALGLCVKKTADLGDQIYELSQKTGVGTETLSGYKLAAEQNGISLETLAKSLKILAGNMVSFTAESKEGKNALTALGISTEDSTGKLKPLDEIMLEVADKFAVMEDGTLKNAMATKIFGRAGMDLIPMLNMGSAGLKEMYEAARKSGMILTKEGAKGCDDFNDALNLLKTGLQGVGKQIATALMPTIQKMIGNITVIVQKGIAWAEQHKKLVKTMALITGAIGGMLVVLGPLLFSFGHLLITLPKIIAGFQLMKVQLATTATMMGIVTAALLLAYGAFKLLEKIQPGAEIDKQTKAYAKLAGAVGYWSDFADQAARKQIASQKELTAVWDKYGQNTQAAFKAIAEGAEGPKLKKLIEDLGGAHVEAFLNADKQTDALSKLKAEMEAASKATREEIEAQIKAAMALEAGKEQAKAVIGVRRQLTDEIAKATMKEREYQRFAISAAYEEKKAAIQTEITDEKAKNGLLLQAAQSRDAQLAALEKGFRDEDLAARITFAQLIADQEDAQTVARLEALKTFAEQKQAIQDGINQMTMTELQYKLWAMEQERIAEEARIKESTEWTGAQQEELLKALDAFYKKKKQKAEADAKGWTELVTSTTSAITNILGSLFSNTLDAFKKWGEGGASILGALGEAFKSTVNTALSALRDLVTGMLLASVKEVLMAKAVAIANVIKSVMQSIPFPLNLALVGVAIAGVSALFSKIHLAEGGIVTRPTYAMIGERGPEAVIPLDRPGALAFAGAGVTLRQSNYFYGAINNAGDLDEISRRLAERTTQAISKGRRY